MSIQTLIPFYFFPQCEPPNQWRGLGFYGSQNLFGIWPAATMCRCQGDLLKATEFPLMIVLDGSPLSPLDPALVLVHLLTRPNTVGCAEDRLKAIPNGNPNTTLIFLTVDDWGWLGYLESHWGKYGTIKHFKGV